MITASAIIGKLVEFIGTKLLGRLADLPFDKRKKACRSLTKLYFCVEALDEVTEEFDKAFHDFKDRGNAEALVHALNNKSHDISLTTNGFVDLGKELDQGLQLVDPALALCCHLLYLSKFDFLSFLSESVRWEEKGGRRFIVIKRPKGLMEGVDMEELYRDAQEGLRSTEKFYWPESALDEFDKDFEDVEITFEDTDTAYKIHEMIIHQNKRLKEAKHRLRELIKSTFKIEEILFQNDSKPGYRIF
jgi:hypothetical protein